VLIEALVKASGVRGAAVAIIQNKS
jgi:hypothetical protein